MADFDFDDRNPYACLAQTFGVAIARPKAAP